MNCPRARMALVERELGELTLGFERGLADHLEACAACREHAARERLLVTELGRLSLAELPQIDVRVRVMQRVRELPRAETQVVPQRQLAWAALAAVVAAAVVVAGIRSETGWLADASTTVFDGSRALLSAAGSMLTVLKGLLVLPWRILAALGEALAPMFDLLGRLEPLAVAAISVGLLSMMLTIAWVVGNDLRRPWRNQG